jgi:hypothetical protein
MTFLSDNSGSPSPAPSGESPAADDNAPSALGGIDLDELAERVYQRWVDELRRERERSGTRW